MTFFLTFALLFRLLVFNAHSTFHVVLIVLIYCRIVNMNLLSCISSGRQLCVSLLCMYIWNAYACIYGVMIVYVFHRDYNQKTKKSSGMMRKTPPLRCCKNFLEWLIRLREPLILSCQSPLQRDYLLLCNKSGSQTG